MNMKNVLFLVYDPTLVSSLLLAQVIKVIISPALAPLNVAIGRMLCVITACKYCMHRHTVLYALMFQLL